MTTAHLRLSLFWAFGLLLIAALYLPGLPGGFILDDHANLAPLQGYVRGELHWQAVVLENESGPLGRPLSMASLLLSAASSGLDPAAFKLANLLLHLGCATLIALLTQAVLREFPEVGGAATTIALATALLWGLLPMHVSTVLYTVQRMAVQSALFTVLALWLYCVARRRAIEGRPGAALLLWLCVPATTIAAVLSKENGALTPMFALLIESFCFRWRGDARFARGLRAWYACLLALPVLLALIAFVRRPDRFLAGYAFRPYTLYERLLTELRVLWEYVAATLFPTGGRLGLMHDDYQQSFGFLAPPSTLLAALAWIAALAGAVWLSRRGRPLVLLGLLFFLVGHALESTIFPLELYFLHRNYLPSLGLLWILIGIGLELRSMARGDPLRFGHPATICVSAALVAYALGTYTQTLTWGNNENLFRNAVQTHPDSERAHAELAALLSNGGRADEAVVELREAARVSPANASAYALAEMLADCNAGRVSDAALDRRIVESTPSAVSLPAAAIYTQLSERVESGGCNGLDPARVVAIGQHWLAQDRGHGPSWQIHYRIARLESVRGEFAAALPHALAAWRASGREPRVGILALQLYATLGDIEGCRRQLAEVRAVDRGRDRSVVAAIDSFQAFVDSAPPRS